MAKLIILGSSNAIPSKDHENTHMVVVGEKRVVLVDCVSNPVVRLEQAGVELNSITDLVITHFHPDHVSGVPLLLMDMWLTGRRHLLNVYGLHYTLDRLEGLMNSYEWGQWPDFFPVAFHRLPISEMTPVLDCPEFQIFSSPVRHMIPTIGLRFEFKPSSRVLAYSCDTEPCSQVVRLASGADVLIHESAGEARGHSSAAQAGEIARQAEVGALYLIHYPTGTNTPNQDLARQASQHYPGPVSLAIDFMTLDF